MNRRSIAFVASLALLAGCGTDQRSPSAAVDRPASPSAVSPPVDMLGTWTDPAGQGFIALGARQIVVAIDGTPRLVALPVENAIEPGMSAGKIGLAGGSALFIARGMTIVQGLPVDHLDVEVVGVNGASVRRRLLSESGLRMASRMVQPPVVAPSVAVIPVDRHAIFISAVPPSQRPAAEVLVTRAQAGAERAELATVFGEGQRQRYVRILAMVMSIRTSQAGLPTASFAEADRMRMDSESFAVAWRAWMAARG